MNKLIHTTIVALLLCLPVSLAACEPGGDEKAATKSDSGSKAGDDGAADGAAEAGADDGAAEGGDDGEAIEMDPKVEQAVTVANAIAADPASADSILEEAGLDRESFEALLYEIAKDPEMSNSYAVARDA